MSNWIKEIEAALSTKPSPGIEIIPSRRPPLFDAEGIHAVMAPVLAAFMWTAALFRETLTDRPLDSLSLLLRLLALALTVRALLLGLRFWNRFRAWMATSRHALALSEEGIFLRTPRCDIVMPREEILEIRERGDWRERSGRRWSDVYVVMRPESGRIFEAIPPFFEKTPGVLAERLMRWLGPPPASPEPEYPEPHPLASKLYENVASGERPSGVLVIFHGWGWVKDGPYATVLLGIAMLDGFIRAPASALSTIGPLTPMVMAFCLVAIPIIWIWFVRREIKPRKGIALLLTPAEMMMRTRSGVHRIGWSNLQRMQVRTRNSWSILEGYHESRTLILHRKNSPVIRYEEAFLGAPIEVVISLTEAYRKGLIAYKEHADGDGAEG